MKISDSEMKIMNLIWDAGAPVTTAWITQRLGDGIEWKATTILTFLARLEEKGCITRRASPTDGRCRLVSLTEAGQARVDAFRAVMSNTGRRYASILSEEEETALRDLLSRIIETLESEVNNL